MTLCEKIQKVANEIYEKTNTSTANYLIIRCRFPKNCCRKRMRKIYRQQLRKWEGVLCSAQ